MQFISALIWCASGKLMNLMMLSGHGALACCHVVILLPSTSTGRFFSKCSANVARLVLVFFNK